MSQQEVTKPPFFFFHDSLERSWYRLLSKHQLIPVPNIPTLVKNYTTDYDCLIITGGNDSLARHQTENLLYHTARQHNKIIIGVCHGAFAINDLENGVNGKIEQHYGCEHSILLDNVSYNVNSFHSQCIQILADDFVITSVDAHGNIESFEHQSRPIYGIVWHPERMIDPVLPEKIKQILL